MRRSSGHKKHSVWGDNSYNVKYSVKRLSVFKTYKLYDIIFDKSKRQRMKQPYYAKAKQKLGGRKKTIIIRTKSIGLSTDRWKDLNIGSVCLFSRHKPLRVWRKIFLSHLIKYLTSAPISFINNERIFKIYKGDIRCDK